MHYDVSPELAEVFIQKICDMGYTVIPPSDENLLLTVLKHGKKICDFRKDGVQLYSLDCQLGDDRLRLGKLLSDLKLRYDLYRVSKSMHIAEPVPGYRIISEYGDYIFAAKLGKDKEIHFTTWRYNYDRSGVTQGHYFETNFETAKRDFAIRAALMDEDQFFNERELTVLHDACVFRIQNDGSVSFDDADKLQALVEKIKSIISTAHI